MPELPEVETIRKQLQSSITGKTISSIEVLNPGSFRAEKNSLIGKTIVEVSRKGKVIVVFLERPGLAKQGQALYVHLKMSGQLKFEVQKSTIRQPAEYKNVQKGMKHLRVAINLEDGSQLQFYDQRKFGWISDNSAVLPKGIDALEDSLTVEKIEEILGSSGRPVKTILLDQSKIAGIGNIYASEILWESKISPFKKGQALSQRQGLALIKSIKKTLTEAIKYGGSTMDDGLYQHVSGKSGNYWSRRRVYDREGEPCLRCKTPVKKGVIGQRSTYWCPECQMVR